MQRPEEGSEDFWDARCGPTSCGGDTTSATCHAKRQQHCIVRTHAHTHTYACTPPPAAALSKRPQEMGGPDGVGKGGEAGGLARRELARWLCLHQGELSGPASAPPHPWPAQRGRRQPAVLKPTLSLCLLLRSPGCSCMRGSSPGGESWKITLSRRQSNKQSLLPPSHPSSLSPAPPHTQGSRGCWEGGGACARNARSQGVWLVFREILLPPPMTSGVHNQLHAENSSRWRMVERVPPGE